VSNIASELELVHFSNADNLDLKVRMEVTAIHGIAKKSQHLLFESVDIFKACVEANEDRDLFPHGLASSDVLDV
jgi:hypothetical protein